MFTIIYNLKIFKGIFLVYFPFVLIYLLAISSIFLSLLTIKQVKKGLRDIKEFRTFKYNKIFGFILFIFAKIVNLGELIKHKNEIKKKSKEMIYIAIFPVQKYMLVSITGVEFTPRKEKFISENELYEINKDLSPGDILLKRNDWQATNLGISGFWTHSGIYVGNIDDMDQYFCDVEELNGQKFSDKLKETNNEVYSKIISNSDLSVIESIDEGVSLKPLANIAKVDYFSALRPRLTKSQKLEAILKAFSYVGSPYDYHFDISSDDAFTCTEVIKKSFGENLSLISTKKLGKIVVFPNSIAKKYEKERQSSKRELDFVLFYDLDLNSRKAIKSTEEEFFMTYKRNILYYRNKNILRYLSTIVEI